MKDKKLEKVLLTHQTNNDFNKVINENARLVMSIVNKYCWNSSISYDELMLIGQEGLYKAYLKFDVSKGCKFSSFAYNYIKNEILEAVATYNSSGVMSSSDVKNIYKINRIVRQFVQSHNHQPSVEEISRMSDGELSPMKVKMLMSSSSCRSLDANISEDLTLGDVIASEEDETYDKRLNNKVEEMLQVLNDEERIVMTHFYFEDITNFTEIARLMKSNANHIRTIYFRAIKRLKSSNIRSIKEEISIQDEKLKRLN